MRTVQFLQDNTLRHRNTNLCLQINSEGTKLEMKPCTGVDRQIWYWKRKQHSSTNHAVPISSALLSRR